MQKLSISALVAAALFSLAGIANADGAASAPAGKTRAEVKSELAQARGASGAMASSKSLEAQRPEVQPMTAKAETKAKKRADAKAAKAKKAAAAKAAKAAKAASAM